MADDLKVDPNLIVALDAILNELNLTRAGDRIGMTQPAVSNALARLRKHYNDDLVVRVGRTYELTPRGAQIKPLVREAMIEIERTYDLLPNFDPATSTRNFQISASDYLLAELTSPLLKLLSKEAPGVGVAFDTLPTAELVSVNDLHRRDLVVTGTGRGVPGKRRSLFSDQFVCIAASDNPVIENGKISLKGLSESRHVMSNFGEANATPVDDMLMDAGISPRIGETVQGFLPVPFMVSGTTMIGHVPERVAKRYAKILDLSIVETPVKPVLLIEAAHWHPAKSEDPAIQWLVKTLRRAAEIVEFGEE